MRHAIALAILILATPAAQAQQAEARALIQNQLEAFKADDFGEAFKFAAPGIQGLFGSSERFGAMVRNGYPMVWRPGTVRYLDLYPRDGKVWQRVAITDDAGRLHFLDYEIVPTADGLRIGAVIVVPAPEIGA